jgi:hypothetical protein
MRHSNLAAAVLLGVGILTTRVGAQQTETPADKARTNEMQMLSRRTQASLENALKSWRVPRVVFEFQGDVDHLRPPVDCAMPVIKGDPAVDPQFSKVPTPGDQVRHTIKVVPVQPCPGSLR